MKTMTCGLALLFSLAACGGSAMEQPEDDLAFIDAMVVHHRSALEMADHEIARGASADLKAMAAHMKTAQQEEIDRMLAVRVDLEGDAEVDDDMDDQHMADDMTAMASLSGAALDRRFIDEMIPHHAGALEMSHHALPFLESPVLRDIASTGMEMQAKEIGEMEKMRSTMPIE